MEMHLQGVRTYDTLAAMHHARATLREQGYRLTPQRNLIWEVLRDAGRHMTAEEVTQQVRRALPDVNVSTVYRTLELLVGLELVVETHLEGSACYYEVSPEPTHHHFVCTQCGTVGHFSDDLLAPVYTELGEAHGFTIGQIQLTAFGLCRECQAGAGPGGERSAAATAAGPAAPDSSTAEGSGHAHP
jgi:Fur family ferric uptake transcriptional regulator